MVKQNKIFSPWRSRWPWVQVVQHESWDVLQQSTRSRQTKDAWVRWGPTIEGEGKSEGAKRGKMRSKESMQPPGLSETSTIKKARKRCPKYSKPTNLFLLGSSGGSSFRHFLLCDENKKDVEKSKWLANFKRRNSKLQQHSWCNTVTGFLSSADSMVQIK